MAIIEVKNLSKSYLTYRKEFGFLGTIKSFVWRKYEYAEAVKQVSFSIEEGERVGFLGPNGAGKTTTLKMLSGIVSPTSGKVEVLGFDPQSGEKAFKKQLGLVVGQKAQLMVDLPAYESFRVNQAIYGIPDKQFKDSLNELIELFNISNVLDIQVRKLSLGQRMKCELVAALLHRPKVLLLDEPTIGLDVVAQKNIRDYLKYYNEKWKTTIMLTSHYMEDIIELCDRVIIVDKGRIIFDGLLKEIFERYAPHKTLHVTFEGKGISKKEIERFGEVISFTPHSASINVERNLAKDSAVKLLTSKLPVDDILIDEAKVEDIVRTIFNKGSF
jgi:ABC-2 type transport system ATP-binding protein